MEEGREGFAFVATELVGRADDVAYDGSQHIKFQSALRDVTVGT